MKLCEACNHTLVVGPEHIVEGHSLCWPCAIITKEGNMTARALIRREQRNLRIRNTKPKLDRIYRWLTRKR